LLENVRVVRHLAQHHGDLLNESHKLARLLGERRAGPSMQNPASATARVRQGSLNRLLAELLVSLAR
jgi:hypothetical protein